MGIPKRPKFRTYQDDAGEWRWRLFGGNGRQMAQGEGHPSRSNARRAARAIKNAARTASVE